MLHKQGAVDPTGNMLAPVERSHLHDLDLVPWAPFGVLDLLDANDATFVDVPRTRILHVPVPPHDGLRCLQDEAFLLPQGIACNVLMFPCKGVTGPENKYQSKSNHRST